MAQQQPPPARIPDTPPRPIRPYQRPPVRLFRRQIRRQRFAQRYQLPLLLLAGIIAGLFAQALWFGLLLIAVYGLAVFVRKIPSTNTFSLAFLSLLTVIVILLARQNVPLASNFATYTFLLLVIGVASLIVESKPPKPHKSPSRARKRY